MDDNDATRHAIGGDMSSDLTGTDFSKMDDPDFLAERRRVRETIEALTERMEVLDEEFIKRAGAAWKEAVQ